MKCRNCTSDQASPLLWTLDTSTTPLTLECEPSDGVEDGSNLLHHIRHGVRTASELGEILGVHPGTISRYVHRLVKAGQVTVRNRQYFPAKS